MSTTLKINHSSLVPLKEAALAVSYSRDYVARLAREGKIVASQVGRNWYVDLSSLQNFSITARAHESLRNVDLRSERKNELLVKEKIAQLEATAVARQKHHDRDALLVTCTTLCLGFITGISLYSAEVFSGGLLKNFAVQPVLVLQEESLPTEKHVAQAIANAPVAPTVVVEMATETPVFTASATVEPLSSSTEGILLFTKSRSGLEAGSPEELFSDEVSVTYTGENSGLVSYQKSTGEVVTYPFVSVPKNTSTEDVVPPVTP